MVISAINASLNSEPVVHGNIDLKVDLNRFNVASDFSPAISSPYRQAQSVIEATEFSSSTENAKRESVRVSSSIGRAASSGQLSREEAVAIYQQIANLL